MGKHLFEEAICGALQDKTRVLVTHALHFLPQVDWIITIDHGKIAQEGTYADLIADTTGPFSQLMKDFGGALSSKKEDSDEKEAEAIEDVDGADKAPKKIKAIMQEEERATGSVGAHVYGQYFKAAKGYYTVPLLFLSLVAMQTAQVVGSYWLVWWGDE